MSSFPACQAVTVAGDGYRGRMSPHTPNEKFEGATVLKTLQVRAPHQHTAEEQHHGRETVTLCVLLQYGYEGRVPLSSARLFYDISERARRIIESYFLLNSTLHFSYTHLVCRTAITGQAHTLPSEGGVCRLVVRPTLQRGGLQAGSDLRCRGGGLQAGCQAYAVSTGQQDHRSDLSHPIHADNCLLDPEANECWKEPPAYTYRDYRCS